MNEDELKKRTKKFALRALKLVDALPRTASGKTVSYQLADCAASVGANYRSACRSRSRAEFISKLGVVEEEVDEAAYWLEIVMEGGMLKASLVEPLHAEAVELTKIMCSSRITASQNAPKKRPSS